MRELKENIGLLAFDADDTLWDCQSHFAIVEREYARILSDYGSESEVSESLFAVETDNMALLGYGCKAFIISLIENAVAMSGGRITGGDIGRIVALGKTLLKLPGSPLPGVRATLHWLREQGCWKMVVFTKGELLDQENKLHRSGLRDFFDDVVIVSDKTPETYRQLCARFGCETDELLMVGNSFRSDVEPALQVGGSAVHIPFHTEWQHEVTREYAHERLWTLRGIAELPALLS